MRSDADAVPPDQPEREVHMSADKHRGIRRQKQKRAKDMKRQAREHQQAADAQRSSAKASPEQKKA